MSRIAYPRRRPAQSGYALVLIMFFLALLVLSLATAAPTVVSSIQREKESEMIWRGKQYTRGVRMYYTKMNHFPTSLDDLTTPKTGIRFMRKAYKDPMNQVDGSWRLIYVGPNGQLIGSLNNRSLNFGGMGTATAVAGTPSGSLFSQATSQGSMNSINSSGSTLFNSSGFASTQNPQSANTQPTAVSTALANGGAPGHPDSEDSDDPSQPHSLAGPMDASNTFGGNIIGVGSKINKRSFMIYERAKNYRKFEFIWDPSKDTVVGRASTGIGTPIQQNSNGMSPIGAPSSSPFGPAANPNQNQNGNQNPNQYQNSNQSPNPGLGPDPSQSPPLQAPPQ